MIITLEARLREAVQQHLHRTFSLELGPLVVDSPPHSEMGEFALPICFELARSLRRSPRQIAQEIAASLDLPAGFDRMEVAGAGYLNFFVSRTAAVAGMVAGINELKPRFKHKVIVEHTNINPNKAAHIGHLRNATLGDTWVRLLRRHGETVEVQNYIDNTGVQVADVVVAFERLDKVDPGSLAEAIHKLDVWRQELLSAGQLAPEPDALPLASGGHAVPERGAFSFDYVCWDRYAEISRLYEQRPDSFAWRRDTLHRIESGEGVTADIATLVADTIVRCHLRTMERINVGYDVLPRESEILKLQFWNQAFEQLKAAGAVRFEVAGKNAGCWVMDRGIKSNETTEDVAREDETKIIVRSNGTVTYVGKDIAYQLWKFGLLPQEFSYRRFYHYRNGSAVWASALEGESGAPKFGHAGWVFNVIDVRQSYLQDIVTAGLRALGHGAEADRSVHFSYEMVALSPACARELGYALQPGEEARPYVEVSGRKGIGVKADDLIDTLEREALREVEARHPEMSFEERFLLAGQIAIGALRYFLLKYSRTTVIAFDFKEALSFEGETGPYVQYAAVRAANILRKANADAPSGLGGWDKYVHEPHVWNLLWLGARLDSTVEACIEAREPSYLAKYAFQLAQAFNNFYHQHPVLQEPDPARRSFLLTAVSLAHRQLSQSLELMGISVPRAM